VNAGHAQQALTPEQALLFAMHALPKPKHEIVDTKYSEAKRSIDEKH